MQELPKKHNRPDTPLADTPDPKYITFQEKLSNIRKKAIKEKEDGVMKKGIEEAKNYDLLKRQKIKY